MKINRTQGRALAQPAVGGTTKRTSGSRHVGQFVRKAIAIVVSVATLSAGMPRASAQDIIISGYMANPAGNDGNTEYVQLIATKAINFTTSPYSVVWTNNGTASSNGWVAGSAVSYGFNLTSGSVSRGDVFYVGGSAMVLNGSSSTSMSSLTWIRTINVSTTGGDGFGNSGGSGGFLGNGGSNADSIGVFSGTTQALTASSTPIDAVFFGTAVGTAKPSSGGYVLPTNDRYSNSQGTFGNGSNTFLFGDPASGGFSQLVGSFNTTTLSWTTARTLTNVSSPTLLSQIATGITLTASSGSAANLTWNVTSGTWNTSTTNWLNGASSSAYTQGDNVTFSGTGGGTVTLSGSLAPASMTISATAGTYTFSGATASDKISGATSIAKSGAGTAVFTSANDFSGGVSVTGGVVSISGSDQLGNGTITLNGGQLTSTAGSALTLANALTIGGSNGTVDTGAQNLTVNGGATLGGTLTKSGNGTLFLASPTVNAGAGFNVGAGAIQLGGAATSGVYSLATSSTLTGNLTIGGTQRLNVNAGGSITGSGTLQFMTSGALLSQQSGFTGGTVSAPIALNSTGASFTPGVYTTGSYTPGSFVSTIGATSGVSGTAGTFTVNSVISGSADVNISNNSATGGGRGLLVLGGQSTYTGNTMIDANTPDGFSAVSANVQLGVSNALPTSTGLIYGTRSGAGAAVIDLNGFSQQVAFVGDGNQFVAGTKFLTITNLSSGTSTFTIGGSTNATFGGVLASGSAGGSLKLVKQGSGSQTLSGSSTFGGGTTLNAGTLVAGNAAAFGTGAVVVNGGTLDLGSFTIGNAVTVNGGSLANAGNYSGATTITGTVSLGNVPNSTVTVAAGGVLQGTPTVASLGGAGLVSPGNSPGILTAGTLDPSGGIDFALEFTGTAPDYGTAAASVNDVVRLTAGSPFLSSLTGANVVDVYLNVNSFAVNDSFQGGFFTTLSANDLLTALSGATFNFFGKATGGSVAFNGESYNPLTNFAGITGATVSTTAVTANFGGGNVTGSAMQFVIVPEPTALALAALGAALAGSAAWKRRRAA